MTELKTQPALLEALALASRRTLSADELHKQRVSFILGTINESSSVSRSRIEEILDAHEGRKAS